MPAILPNAKQHQNYQTQPNNKQNLLPSVSVDSQHVTPQRTKEGRSASRLRKKASRQKQLGESPSRKGETSPQSRNVRSRKSPTESHDKDSASSKDRVAIQQMALSNMIDKLDLQETIKQKARQYFNHQQRMLQQQEMLNKMNGNQGNIKQQILDGLPSLADKMQHNMDETEEEMLKNVISERKIASSNEVQRRMNYLGAGDMQFKNKVEFISHNRNIPVQNQTQHTGPEKDSWLKGSALTREKTRALDAIKTYEQIVAPDQEQISEQHYESDELQTEPKQLFKQPTVINTPALNSPSAVKILNENLSIQQEMMAIASGGHETLEEESVLPQKKRHTFKFPGVKATVNVSHPQHGAGNMKPMARTMFNRSSQNQRHKLKVEKDYSTFVLGEFKFGLYQKNPKSKSPAATALQKFSQLSEIRFKDTNARYMEIYEQQMVDNRKKRRFLSKQLNKSPEQRQVAKQIRANSPVIRSINNKFKAQVFKTAQILSDKQKALQIENKGILSTDDGTYSSPPVSGLRREKNVFKREQDDKKTKLKVNSPAWKLSQKIQKRQMHLEDDFDFNMELASDPDEPTIQVLKMEDYEEEMKVADNMIDNNEMQGLIMYLNETQLDQNRDFVKQQEKLMKCLFVLFGGDTSKDSFKHMATKLTDKLKKQISESTWKGKQQAAFRKEAEKLCTIDEHNINSQIITIIADEIMKKQDFFDMFGCQNEKTHMIQGSQIAKLDREIKPEEKNTAIEIYKNVNAANTKKAVAPPLNPMQGMLLQKKDTKKSLASSLLAKFDDEVLKEKLSGRNPLQQGLNMVKEAVGGGGDVKEEEKTTTQKKDVARFEMAKADFIRFCEKQVVVALPLLLRIKEKKLILEGYQLNYGVCGAIAMAFEQFSDIATEFILHRNAMTDVDFSVLLKGMTKLSYISSLTYSENHFGPRSLQALKPVLIRTQMKHSLRALHIKNCKISGKTTHDLLFTLNAGKNFIRSLSLVNVNLSPSNFKELSNLIERSRYLIHLDISWNNLRTTDMHELVQVISDNRTLQWLNLSFNQLADTMQSKFQDCNPEVARKRKREVDAREAKNKRLKPELQIPEPPSNSLAAIRKICKFIKMNNNLVHLNLSNCGMTEEMLLEFGTAMRRTKSMNSLHLSGNPGASPEVRAAICERAHVKPYEPIFRPDFKQLHNPEFKFDDHVKHKKAFKLEHTVLLDATTGGAQVQAQDVNEQLALMSLLKSKQVNLQRKLLEMNPTEMFIFNRYLGHKKEMPGSGQWRMICSTHDCEQRCWMCNLDIFSLVFWTREWGMKTQEQFLQSGIDELAYENQLYEIEERNREAGINVDLHAEGKHGPQLYEKALNPVGFPFAYGEWNNWRPQRMYAIEEFCCLMDEEGTNILHQLRKQKLVRKYIKDVSELDEIEIGYYNEKKYRLMKSYSDQRKWRKVLQKNLRYDRPFMANTGCLIGDSKSSNITKIDRLEASDSSTDEEMSSEPSSDQRSDEEFEFGRDRDISPTKTTTFKNLPEQKRESPLQSVGSASDVTSITTVNPKKRSTLGLANNSLLDGQKNATKKINTQLYVLPIFLKPGKHNMIVQANVLENYGDTNYGPQLKSPKGGYSQHGLDIAEQYFHHEITAPLRQEEVKLYVKQLGRKCAEIRQFDVNKTVFRDWKEPTDADFDGMIEHDKQFWKLTRFIKETDKYEDTIHVFKKNIRRMFHLYTTWASNSSYPGVSWLDFSGLNVSCQVLDKRSQGGVNPAAIDRFFLASAEDRAQLGSHRYQFFEAVTRIANEKFKNSGQVKTIAEAVQRLMNQHYYMHGPNDEWDLFRKTIIWTYDVSDILEANETGLKKIWNSFVSPRQKTPLKAHMIALMNKNIQPPIIKAEVDVIYCYGMCKQFVIRETDEKQSKRYNEIQYVEFLEFLCRCAHMKFKDQDDDEKEMDLCQKLKDLLDELLPAYNVQRKEVELIDNEISESDDDY